MLNAPGRPILYQISFRLFVVLPFGAEVVAQTFIVLLARVEGGPMLHCRLLGPSDEAFREQTKKVPLPRNFVRQLLRKASSTIFCNFG